MDDFPERTTEDAKLERLKCILSQRYWNFSLGRNSFDGISEGICLMIGIYPEGSMVTKNEFGPRFLPSGLESFGFSAAPKGNEQSELRMMVHEASVCLEQVRLTGLVSVKKAMSSFAKFDFFPPWLEEASRDVRYAQYIPSTLILDTKIRDQVSNKYRSNGGRARAENNQITKIIKEDAFPVFCELRAQDFEGCRAKSSGRPVNSKIATVILERLENLLRDRAAEGGSVLPNGWEPVLPQHNAIVERVRKWMRGKS